MQSVLNGLTSTDIEFKLSDSFLSKYAGLKPKFGFNGLGEFVYYRTYSRVMPDGRKETFLDTARRVIEGCYEIQRRHCKKIHVPWDYYKAQESAQEMFERMWEFKFLPPGRGLWMMGTQFMWERGSASLNNCAFTSTHDIASEPSEPFHFMMDMAMLGVGVGFDTKGAGKLLIKDPGISSTTYTIPDSREGWCTSLAMLINSYTIRAGEGHVHFDYSQIRPAGSIINGFGGKASGPGILISLHNMTRALLNNRIGSRLSSVDIADLMNYIGKCVVAGNVRRTAQIVFGELHDEEYYSMKNAYTGLTPDEVVEADNVVTYAFSKGLSSISIDMFDASSDKSRFQRFVEVYNACNTHRWASNNSVFAEIGCDYSGIGDMIAVNGEPGIAWLSNMRDYGRMIDGYQPGIDGRVAGGNPCLEQSLESYELCTLVETFPANHDSADDYMRTLKFAYLYGKSVTLLQTHNARTNSVMLRNRRIGLSQSGIVQAFAKFGRRNVLNDFCNAGYNEVKRWDNIYSEWLCVPKSIKTTSVKPSGSVSLVAGATPGIHHPEARSYWRRVRLSKDSILVKILQDAGYHVEPLLNSPGDTVVVKFAVSDERVRPVNEVSIWEQVTNAVDYQTYWADNQVSCTIKFKPSERDDIARTLEAFEDRLKGISFLPHSDHGYAQPPYEPCTPEEVIEYNSKLKDLDFTEYVYEAVGSHFCDGDTCSVV